MREKERAMKPLRTVYIVHTAHLNDIEADVLVEGEEDDVGQSVVAPGTVDEKKLAKEPKLVVKEGIHCMWSMVNRSIQWNPSIRTPLN